MTANPTRLVLQRPAGAAASRLALDTGNWDENEHPRAEGGQFGAGGGAPGGPAAKSARLADETDKQFAKRVIDHQAAPAKLPEEHARYFNMQGATRLKMSDLVSGKSDEDNAQGADNNPKRMAAAYRGELSKRDPITVTPHPTLKGKYLITDGNGTYSSVKRYGWQALPVTIQPQPQARAQPQAHDAKRSRGAGIAFTAPNGAVLFIKRGPGGDHAGQWCLPGGTIEDGESPEQAAVREAREEIGAQPYGERTLHATHEHEGVVYTTFVQLILRPFKARLNGESTSYRWARPGEAPQPLHPGVRAVFPLMAGPLASDAGWTEALHPRADNGQFGSGGGGAQAHTPPLAQPSPTTTTAATPAPGAQAFVAPELYAEAKRTIALYSKAEAPGRVLTQPEQDQAAAELASVVANAQADKPAFDQKLTGIAQALGAELKLAKVKSGARLLEKHVVEYKGNATLMKDLVRGSIVIDNMKDVETAVKAIGAHFEITRVKDRFSKPMDTGYSDMMLNVRLPSGIEGEIQIHIPEMVAAKGDLGHALYDIERKQGPGPLKDSLIAMQKGVYGAATEAHARRTSKGLTPVRTNTSKSAGSMASPSKPALDSLGYGVADPPRKLRHLPEGSLTTGTPSTSRNLLLAGNSDNFIAPPFPAILRLARDWKEGDQPRSENGQFGQGGAGGGGASQAGGSSTRDKLTALFADSLGRKREDMPQVPRTVKADFLIELREHTTVTDEKVDAVSLKPVQEDFNVEVTDRILEEGLSDNPIMVSEDGYVLDGHHRWAVAAMTGAKINVQRVGLPIDELLIAAEDFHQRAGLQRMAADEWDESEHSRAENGEFGSGGGSGKGSAAAKPAKKPPKTTKTAPFSQTHTVPQHPLRASQARVEHLQESLQAAQARGDKLMTGFYRDKIIPAHQAAHKNLQAAFTAFEEHGDGTELSNKDGRRHAVLLPDASEPGRYRYQIFDQNGMVSHHTEDTAEQAVADAAAQGFYIPATGILDRLASTDVWAHGMAINAIIQSHNAGLTSWEDAHAQIQALDKPDGKRLIAQDAEHWITINGGEGKGQPLLISAGGVVLGGAGGSMNGKTLAPNSKSAERQGKGSSGESKTEGKTKLQGVSHALQNRNRSSAASISQMNKIASNPNPRLLMSAPTMSDGAPVVTDLAGSGIAKHTGKRDWIVTPKREFAVRYAVVEADQLSASNRADGTKDDDYATNPDKLVAINNGRTAGLIEAYARGTAGAYKTALMKAEAVHGIKRKTIDGMKSPVLVRIMDAADVDEHTADESNSGMTLNLSASEQARNDAERFDPAGIDFDDDGAPTPEAVRGFVAAMPQNEQQSLSPNGRPTKQAVDRMLAATFHAAYGDTELVGLMAQATDPEARNLIAGMSKAAGAMAKLKDAGDLDIRELVTGAAKQIINAVRSGAPVKRFLSQGGLLSTSGEDAIAQLFAENIRSGKAIGQRLMAAADFALSESQRDSHDMFGETAPHASRGQVLEKMSA